MVFKKNITISYHKILHFYKMFPYEGMPTGINEEPDLPYNDTDSYNPNDETLWQWFLKNEDQLFVAYLNNHNISELRDWQKEYFARDFDDQVDCIIQLPPGAGKTIVSIWIAIRRLMRWPGKRVLYAVPLRSLATQLCNDIKKDLEIIYNAANIEFKVSVAEGPGAKINFHKYHIYVATYEHAAGELRNNPWIQYPNGGRRNISTVIVDEVHEIGKDRGLVVDDILYYTFLRKLLYEEKKSVPPGIIAMSGTLPTWMVDRLYRSYQILFKSVLNIEQENASAGACQVFLPEMPSQSYYPFIKDIVQAMAHERLNGISTLKEHFSQTHPKRAIIFMDTVAHAEEVYLYLATTLAAKIDKGSYPCPQIRFATPKKTLIQNLEKLKIQFPEGQKTDLSKIAQKLESIGVYLHHAQLKDGFLGNESWKDIIERQISSCNPNGDYVAIISTSTLSVGINLQPAQIAFLGPNSLWTIDQAKQMIGRVGRDPRDSKISLAMIVDSPLYSSPCMSSLVVPDSWFIPRIVSAIEFHVGLDIRGFYSPQSAAPVEMPDVPGNGILKLAEEWDLVKGEELNPLSRGALILCRNDSKSLPTTYSFLSFFQENDSISDDDCWLLTLFWAMRITKFPPKWEKSPSNPFLPSLFTKEQIKKINTLIIQYGETHERYPGDLTVPCAANSKQAIDFFTKVIYGIGISSKIYYFHVTSSDEKIDLIIELMTIILNLQDFLEQLSTDVNALFKACDSTGTNIHKVATAIKIAVKFLNKCRNAGVHPVTQFPLFQISENLSIRLSNFAQNYTPEQQSEEFSLALSNK